LFHPPCTSRVDEGIRVRVTGLRSARAASVLPYLLSWLKWKSRVISRSGSGKWGAWKGAVDGNGITEAVMDLAGPEARCEQAEE
jgi:hypothetical protein